MAKKPMPSVDDVRKLLDYDPETGKLFWKPRGEDWFSDGAQTATHNCAIWNGKFAGKEAFTAVTSGGYYQGWLLRNHTRAHRVVWALVHGVWPSDDVDHINGDRGDNRIANLRAVSRETNMRNKRETGRSSTGRIGVYLDKRRGTYYANIGVGKGRVKCLISGVSFAEACAAREQFERTLGYHENHGRPAPM